MKYSVFIIFLAGCLSQEFQEELGVLILNDNNFDQAVQKYDFLLADFYAPWCGHCNELAPHYAQAARTIRSPSLQFAKIDCTQSQTICQRFQIQGYPTIKFFSNQNNVDYTGGRSAQDIIEWVKKRSNVGSQELKKLEQLRNLILQNQVLLVFFGSDQTKQQFQIFSAYARKNNELVPSFHAVLPEFAEEYKITNFPSLILFKQFDERKVIYDGEFSMQQIEEFVERSQYPSLMNFDYKTANKIFGGTKPTLFLLYNQASQKAEKQLRLATSTIKNKILICMANTNDHYGSKLATYLNIDQANLPKLLIVEPNSQNVTQIPFSHEEIISQNIIEFVGSYKKNSKKGHSDL